MIRRRDYLITFILILFSVAAVALGALGLRRLSLDRVNNERKQQLEELTVQLSDTLGNALDFNQSYADMAAGIFSEGEYETEEDVIEAAAMIKRIVLSDEDEGSVLFLLDENGTCYDEERSKGIWGDFNSVVGMEKQRIFIADSPTYEGVHWAFVSRLDKPVATADGSANIEYAVILKPVSVISAYYMSEAYEDVCETYILKENGTRAYNSTNREGTIPSYNIYKRLRENENGYGDSFDDILAALEENGVACGNYETGGTQYCYSLARLSEYGLVLLFLLPVEAVAVNTVAMVSSMMIIFVVTGLIMLMLIILAASVVMRLLNNRRIVELKEMNLQEQKAANERLASLNESLVKANRNTKSALDIARSANRAKSSFLSNMSHDIRTPLNAIIGFLSLLEKHADEPEQVRRYTEKIQVSSRHLLNLINDILDMSRIESGKVTLNSEEFTIGGLLEETRTVFASQIMGRKQELVIDPTDTAELKVRGDKLRLSQILMNLLSNAVKYTQEGGHINVRVERIASQTPQIAALKFAVKDDGVGMSPEFQKRVFEPFEREQTSTASGIQGTGLGMAITKNLVDLMGGIIYVNSVQGKGSTFTMELSFPVVTGDMKEQTEAEAAIADAEESSDEASVLNGLRFLVAEDNDINAEIIRELLSMEGADCDIAVNGEEALRLFEQSEPGSYDAVFMDIQMPVMDGYESTRRIRASAHPDAQSIPIAAMTANAFAEDVQKALQSGMNTHIPKPVDMKKIREFIAGEKEDHRE